jgi:hypothetical protein
MSKYVFRLYRSLNNSNILSYTGIFLAEWLERLTANAKVATVLGPISASSDTEQSEVSGFRLMSEDIQYIICAPEFTRPTPTMWWLGNVNAEQNTGWDCIWIRAIPRPHEKLELKTNTNVCTVNKQRKCCMMSELACVEIRLLITSVKQG